MKNQESLLRTFYRETVGSENRFLFAVWTLAVVLILGFGFVLNSSTVSLMGVAESREYQVNFDTPVEIKHIYVFPSQSVKKGDLLIELNQSELTLQLRALKARYDKLQAELKLRDQISRIANDRSALQTAADPLKVDLADTKKEIDLVEHRLQNLFVFAEVDGTVGAVNFKNGEKAPAFAALITLLPQNPSYVNGFMNENLSSSLEVGQKVEVFSSNGKTVQGIVTHVGARIVPIPERLLRIQTLPSWGREVVVKIPPRNSLLLGEKVSVKKSWGISFLSLAQADQVTNKWIENTEPSLEDVRMSTTMHDDYEPELSGMIYMPELQQFLLISDDYPEGRPFLYMMDEKGELQDRQLYIEQLTDMEDIESISRSGDTIYLMSSLSLSKKGKEKEERQQFARIRRDGVRFVADGQVDLRKLILAALAKSQDANLRDILAGSDEFEVEGHVIEGADLIVSLKGPILTGNEGLLLRIKDFARVFNGAPLQAEDVYLERKFAMLWNRENVDLLVTDLISEPGGGFYIATSCRKVPCSAVWHLPAGASKAELISEFPVPHLEGLALLPKSSQLFGVFDDKHHSRFFSIPLAPKKGSE